MELEVFDGEDTDYDNVMIRVDEDCDGTDIESKQVIVNNLVTFEPISSTYNTSSDTTGYPEEFVGKFSFEARLENTGSSTISCIEIEVMTLTNGNMLQNADGGPGEEGSRLQVQREGDYLDGKLSPGE